MKTNHQQIAPSKTNVIDRRQALVAASSAGLLYSFSLPLFTKRAEAASGQASAVGAFVRVDSDETITIFIGVAEMGQGVLSGLAQVLAEELMLDWSHVAVQSAPANPAYGNPILRGTQATFGSLSMRGLFAPMRKAGAVVREMLKMAAASAINAPISSLTAANGAVFIAGTNSSLTYGALAFRAGQMTPPADAPLLGSGRFIGTSIPRADIPVKVNGAAIFGIDVQLPGMVFAAVQNCPVAGGTTPAGFMPLSPSGTIAAVALPTAVAVVAKDTYTAIRAARNLSVPWTIPPGNSSISSASISAQAQQLMATGTVQTAETVGFAQSAILAAAKKLDLTYSVPYLAHACMEVLNCTALVTASTCTIWAPTQAQSAVVATATTITGLPASAIIVNTTFLGGGLGRKIEQDFISQAIRIAQTELLLVWLTPA